MSLLLFTCKSLALKCQADHVMLFGSLRKKKGKKVLHYVFKKLHMGFFSQRMLSVLFF